jgi:hypothetical protein
LVVRQETNGFAIASLVLGILWLGGLGAVLAIIFGHLALRRIRRPYASETGRGLAVAGLVLGYVGVAVPAALVVGALVLSNTTGSNEPFVPASPSNATSTTETPSIDRTTIPTEDLDPSPPAPSPPSPGTPSDALEVETLIPGHGVTASNGDTLVVHYVGVLADGTVFDSSWESDSPSQ